MNTMPGPVEVATQDFHEQVHREITNLHTDIEGHPAAEDTLSPQSAMPAKTITSPHEGNWSQGYSDVTIAQGKNGMGDKIGEAVRYDGTLTGDNPKSGEPTAELHTQDIGLPRPKTVAGAAVTTPAGRYSADISASKGSLAVGVKRDGYEFTFKSPEKRQRAAELIAQLAGKRIREGIPEKPENN